VKYCGPKHFLAAALVLTLGLKLLLYHGEAPPAEPEALGQAVSSFLFQHGFESRLEKKYDQVLVYANAGKCRMVISEAAPQGWNRSSIEIWAKPVGRLSYVFDGVVYADEPFLAPIIDEYWTRVRFKMGLTQSCHPVLAVAASDECAINALPWSEFAMTP
jgi:hypothetical protein